MEVIFSLIALPFWCWMFYDCTRHEYHRTNWCVALILLNVIGAVYYFLVRWLPRHSSVVTYRINRWAYRDQLRQLEAEARNIGKTPQFLRLGQLYTNMGWSEKALSAYDYVLTQDPQNRQALWEAACLHLAAKKWDHAYGLLDQLMAIDPGFKYGDLSLVYGRVLFQLGDLDKAYTHFEKHLKNWSSHPEAYLLMAEIARQRNDIEAARGLLEKMIAQMNSAPAFYYRQHRHFVAQGQKILKTLAV